MSEISKPQLEYIVNHVFLPPKLPDSAEPKDLASESDGLLCRLVLDAASEFSGEDGGTTYTQNSHHWGFIIKLLQNLLLPSSTATIQDSLYAMQRGGVSSGQHIKPLQLLTLCNEKALSYFTYARKMRALSSDLSTTS